VLEFIVRITLLDDNQKKKNAVILAQEATRHLEHQCHVVNHQDLFMIVHAGVN
jgi:hypothetical protein